MNEPSSRFRKRMLLAGLASLAVAYLGVVLSPLPEHIGRNNPSLASLLSPPLFNFNATYDSGSVLGLRMGMTRAEFQKYIRQNFQDDVLLGNCGGRIGLPHLIPVTGDSVVAGEVRISIADAAAAFSAATEREVVCLNSTSKPRALLVFFSIDLVDHIKLGYIRNELP